MIAVSMLKDPFNVDPNAFTMQQVKLYFATLKEATDYADKNGWRYAVELPQARHVTPKAYADNFAYNRIGRWTH